MRRAFLYTFTLASIAGTWAACGSSDDVVFGNSGSASSATSGGAGPTTSASTGGDPTSSSSSMSGPTTSSSSGGPSSSSMASTSGPASSSAAGGGDGGAGQGGNGPGGSGPGGSGPVGSGGQGVGGSGGGPLDVIGCSDGTREYFADVASQPNIAGCDGGFEVPGVVTPASMQQQCGGVSGNDSMNPDGNGCSVADLCATGWHVCDGSKDVAAHSATGFCEPPTAISETFYITRQGQDGVGNCIDPPATNNITGCGTLGDPPIGLGCAPLDTRMRAQECIPTMNWFCGGNVNGSTIEAEIVLKIGSGEGGALCCKNP